MAERLFGTDGLRGPVNIYPMTVDVALRLGLAAGVRFRKGSHQHRVVIGKDTRLSGYMFESALTAGLCAAGMHVIMTGPLPTPAISFLTRNMRADLGVVISASHNPYSDNGIKFFDADGFKLPDDVENEISAMVLDPDMRWPYPDPDRVGRASKIEDAGGRYIVYTKSCFPAHLTLSGLRIVIDCANGAAYKVAPLALDGDADRLIVVDEKGNVLDGDQLMALGAQAMMERGELPGNMLVATAMSNLALEIFMKERAGTLLRTKVGDRYVMEAMRKTGAMLGGEQSGHLIYRQYSTTGDGLLAALQLLRIVREKEKPLSELAGLLHLFPQKLINVRVEKKLPFEERPAIGKAVADVEKALAGRGRVLLRYSGTEALCRVMVEAEDEDKVVRYARDLADVVSRELR